MREEIEVVEKKEKGKGGIDNPKYKSKLCMNFAKYGTCSYGNRCQYAHGKEEMRKCPESVHCKYKTKPCLKYHMEGYCKYGGNCSYIHNETYTLEKEYLWSMEKQQAQVSI